MTKKHILLAMLCQELPTTCGIHAISMHDGQFWEGSQPGPGCESERRSAAGVDAPLASSYGQQRQKGSLPHGHNIACSTGGPQDKLSPVSGGHSLLDLGHLKRQVEYEDLNPYSVNSRPIMLGS